MDNKKYNIASAVAACIKYAPLAASLYIALNIISGILPPIMVYITAAFINAALTLASPAPQGAALAYSAALMLTAYAYSQLSPILGRVLLKSIENCLSLELRAQIIKKQASLDFELTENETTLNLIEQVSSNAEGKFIGVLSAFAMALGLILGIAGVFSILFSYIWWLPLAFLLCTVPLIVFSYKGGKATYKSYRAVNALTREMNYLSEILTSRETAAERTLFGYTKKINDKFKATHLKRSNQNTKTIAVEMTRSKSCGIALFAFVLLAMFFMLDQLEDKTISTGMYIAIIGAMINVVRIFSSSLSNWLYDLSQNIEYFKDFNKFFALPGDENVLKYDKKEIKFEEMTIKNLWFRYKDTDEYVLKGINLHIKKGKSYSLIGKNGAGKTTLTKIITGLYRNFEGEIAINGRDIKEYGTGELRNMFSVVYQDYAKYYISLKDNVAFGADVDDFETLAKTVELDALIASLPKGKDTPLGKIFEGGTDVSGGEWQKIAIMRTMHRNCPFMILDEPTASLDPMMETKIYGEFAKLSVGHTSLLISHRLGSTKISETLLVLDEGKIAECGSHFELMQKKGLYAQMFDTQRSWYV